MATIETAPWAPRGAEDFDNRVVLHGITWAQFEEILAARGDHGGVRMTYLEGELELMSPSYSHEGVKTTLARLVEAYGDERGLELSGFGSWTVRSAPRERGIEPDECYILGVHGGREEPDFAIEVEWTRGGIDKLEVYRGLGVREVWWWREGAITVYALRGDRYEVVPRSELLPELDMPAIAALATSESQSGAVRAFRATLRP